MADADIQRIIAQLLGLDRAVNELLDLFVDTLRNSVQGMSDNLFTALDQSRHYIATAIQVEHEAMISYLDREVGALQSIATDTNDVVHDAYLLLERDVVAGIAEIQDVVGLSQEKLDDVIRGIDRLPDIIVEKLGSEFSDGFASISQTLSSMATTLAAVTEHQAEIVEDGLSNIKSVIADSLVALQNTISQKLDRQTSILDMSIENSSRRIQSGIDGLKTAITEELAGMREDIMSLFEAQSLFFSTFWADAKLFVDAQNTVSPESLAGQLLKLMEVQKLAMGLVKAGLGGT